MSPPLDTASFTLGAEPSALGLGDRALLYPGHYGPDSGIEEALDAFSRLPPGLEDSVLVIACRTRMGQDSGEEELRVRAIADAAGIAHRVRLVGSTPDIHALIVACAATVLVPRYLAGKMDLPLVLLEAQRLGRPVVAADMLPMSEAVAAGAGFKVAHGDVPALTDAMTRLLEDTELRSRMGERGERVARACCEPSIVIRAYHDIYAEVLGRVR